MTQSWPMRAFHLPGHCDWLKDEHMIISDQSEEYSIVRHRYWFGHVTKPQPMRVSPGTLLELLGQLFTSTGGVSKLVSCQTQVGLGKV